MIMTTTMMTTMKMTAMTMRTKTLIRCLCDDNGKKQINMIMMMMMTMTVKTTVASKMNFIR